MNALFQIAKKVKTIILGLVLIIALAFPAGVAASPSSKKAELSRLKNQVDSVNQQIELIDEDYLQAKIKLNRTARKISVNTIVLRNNQQKLSHSRNVLSGRIRVMYKNGTFNIVQLILNTKSFNELITNLNFITRIGQTDGHLINKVFRLTKQIEKNKIFLESNLKQQRSLVKQIGNKKSAIESEISRKKRLISGLESELAAYEREQERRQLALRPIGGDSPPINTPPPTNAPRSSVVQIAMKYLGRPYQWGAAGPDRFDCSGLTMYVYAQVGVGLPHSSRAQSQMGQYVTRGQLQPGDLLFSGNPIHHVGIYIGGGRMISAPQTGDVVKISPIRRNFRWGRRV